MMRRRNWDLLLVIFSITLISVSCQKNVKDEDSTSNIEETINYEIITGENTTVGLSFVNDMIALDFNKIKNSYNFIKEMKEAVDNGSLKLSIASSLKMLGDVKEIKKAYEQKSGVYQIVKVPIEFQNNNTNINVVFTEDGEIAGVNFSDYQEELSVLMPDNIIESDITVKNGEFNLAGTLTMPKEGDKFPLVVLIQGSGPSDRDETILGNKPFRDIAWGLAKRGVASIRYDKRTFAYKEQCIADKSMTVYDETVSDAVAASRMAKEIDRVDPLNIYILGHSLGGNQIPSIAKETLDNGIKGYIIMAGNVSPLSDLILYQTEYIANADNNISVEEKKQIEQLKTEMEKLKSIDNLSDEDVVLGAYKAYWKNILEYNPIEVAKDIKSPILVLQGERDYQVTVDEFNLWKNEFKDKDNWTFITYQKLNHLMMAGEGNSTPAEYSKSSVVDSKVMEDISQFIKNN